MKIQVGHAALIALTCSLLSGATAGGGDRDTEREACTPSSDGTAPPTPGEVASRFKQLTWPRAALNLQPPGGATLVNLPTIAWTSDPGADVQGVSLRGSEVEVEATPVSWTWHWGDGAVDTTNEPGAPYPDDTITHRYVRAETVSVRVDVTYEGRYRVNGGAWRSLAETHTVRGESAQLDVLEAITQLVD